MKADRGILADRRWVKWVMDFTLTLVLQGTGFLKRAAILRHCRIYLVFRRYRKGHLARQSPHRELCTVACPDLPENPVQILLDRPFRQVQLKSNFLIELGFAHQMDYLLLSKAQLRVDGF